MLLDTLNKLLIVLFFMSCLNTARHVYYLFQTWFTSTEEYPIKYKITDKSLFLLGVSIAYILTAIITGIKL
jgi:hypothetical protein